MRLTSRQRNRLPDSAFVFPRGTKTRPGHRGFPVENVAHGRAALSRAAQARSHLTPAERCAVVRKVCPLYPEVATCRGEGKSAALNRCAR